MEYEIYFLASSLQMLPVVIWLVHLIKKNQQTKAKEKKLNKMKNPYQTSYHFP